MESHRSGASAEATSQDTAPSQDMMASSTVTRWLARSPQSLLAAFASLACFLTYFASYAFRKPFQAATYAELMWAGMDLKTAAVVGQTLGYAFAKVVSIKVVSELARRHRARALLLTILGAELALLLFGWAPMAWKVPCIAANGFFLGMIWGTIGLYLEGRRITEFLLASLSCVFIVASGVVKDIGLWLLRDMQLSIWWMPAAAGALFFPAYVLGVWMLDRMPDPNADDRAARAPRAPMGRAERLRFVRHFALGLTLHLMLYGLITAYRDFRDAFGVEVLASLGFAKMPAVFTRTESAVAALSMVGLALLGLVKDNRRALLANFLMMWIGAAIIGLATLALHVALIDGFVWMILIGFGAFLLFIPNAATFCERLVASSGLQATAVFLMFVVDSFGYVGSVGVQLYKSLWQEELSYLRFLMNLSYVMSATGLVLLGFNAWYFYRKTDPARRLV